MEVKNNHETTQDPGPAKMESAICDYLKKVFNGDLDPWKIRLSTIERNLNLQQLVKKLGSRYQNCTLENYEIYDPGKQLPVLNRIRNFAERMPEYLSAGSGMVILGKPGTGKDHMAAALLKIAIGKHRLSADWFDGGMLFDEIAEAIQNDRWNKLREKISKPQILCVSDPVPPRGDMTDSQLRRLRDLIDKRYRDGLSTWITTNVDTQKDAEQLLTKPVLERIKEGSAQIFCDWQSHRERKKSAW